MKTVKWGVIGSGGIARRKTIPEGIVKAEHAELTAVYDINPTVNRAVSDEYGALCASSVSELLDADLDAVYVATPVSDHVESVVATARSGRHVLCEKPLGLSIHEAERMANTCREANVSLGTGFVMRFVAQHQEALRLIEAGRIGTPVYGRAQLSCWYPPIDGAWRQDPATAGGGSLVDLGSHCIDLLEMFLGRVARVSCFVQRSVHDYACEDSAVVSLVFENGAIGTVDAFFCIPDASSPNRLELYGSKGSILASGTLGQGEAGRMAAYLAGGYSGYDALQERTLDAGDPIEPRPVNPYMAEIEEFSQAILEGRPPANDAAIGLRNQKILAACYESARTGAVVDVLPSSAARMTVN